MIAAVTFDLWQTLILDTPEGLRRARDGRIDGAHAALQRHGIPVTRDAVAGAYEEVGRGMEAIWARGRDVGTEGQVALMMEALGEAALGLPDAARDEIEEAYRLPILDALPLANDGALEVLRGLREDGFAVGLICNTGRTPGRMLRIVLDRLGLAPFIHATTFSDEMGLRKPDPRVFHTTLAKLGALPAGSVHVGDDPTTDVAGAKAAGMAAILLGSAGPAPAEGPDCVQPEPRFGRGGLRRAKGAEEAEAQGRADAAVSQLQEIPAVLARLRGRPGM